MARTFSLKRVLPQVRSSSRASLDRHRRRLTIEGLEPRQLLAADVGPALDPGPVPDTDAAEPRGGITPSAANLTVRDAYITDQDGNRIDRPAIGTRVYVQAEFSTTSLPASCSYPTECRYDVKFSIDGDDRWSGPLDWGIGQTGTRLWVARLGEWLVTPGGHSVNVHLDASSRIAEVEERDNLRTFRFVARGFESAYGENRFITPIDGVPNGDYSIVNYADLQTGNGIRDFNGGNYTYDGHDAIDYTAANFARTDIGLPIVAAAAGVVSDINDGEFDRNTCPSPCNLAGGNWGNYVSIDHGNGWVTNYVHLRRDSIVVSEGDFVGTGRPLGLMGSSGNSTDTHLHFRVTYLGEVVETYVAPPTYWANPVPYAGYTPGVLDFGTTDHNPTTNELKERPAERELFPASSLQPVHFWVQLHGISAGDQLQFIWRRPDGTIYDSTTYTSGQIRYGWQTDEIRLPLIFPPPGEWSVEFRRNGSILAKDTFQVGGTTGRDGGFEFDAANYYTTENSGQVRLTVQREGPSGATTVRYTTLSQTAAGNSDYVTSTGTVVFAHGQLEQTISIPIIDDGFDEPTQRFLVMLSDPSTGTFLGTQWLVGVNIFDNDVLAADFNGDSVISGGDFLVWQENFGIARGATHAQGDSDRDGDVDGVDFLMWQQMFNRPDGGNGAAEEASSVTHDRYRRAIDTSFVTARRTDEHREGRGRIYDLAFAERAFPKWN